MLTNKNQKIATALLAATMAAGMVVPAFAADTEITDAGKMTANTAVTGTTEVPTIKITVPQAADVIVNPYGLKVKADLNRDDTEEDVADQIISVSQFIQNESGVPINVSVTVTGKAANGVQFSTAALKDTETAKKAYVYFEMMEATYNDGDSKFEEPSWESAYDKSKHILLSTTAQSKANMVTMPATDDSTSITGAGFHLVGSVTKEPTTSWTAKDTVNATIAFTFSIAATDAT